MSAHRLQVFLSSKMEELAPERAAIAAALEEMNVDTFVFERSAGARPQPIRDTFEEAVHASHLYIGVFWKGYGRYTIEEFEHATRLGMARLVYEKRDGGGSGRDPELQLFLDQVGDVGTGLTAKWFSTIAELRAAVKEDVAHWQVSIVERVIARRRGQTGQPADGVLEYLLKQAVAGLTPLDMFARRERTLRMWLRAPLERAVRTYLDETLGAAPLKIVSPLARGGSTEDDGFDRWREREARVRDLVGRAIEHVPDDA